MAMWLRLAGALLVTLAAIGVLEFFAAGAAIADRTPSEVQEAAHGRPREFFWFLLFAVVMATSLLAAAHRAAGRLRHAVRRRD
ncbi:MAG: hypothetical protein JWQ29_1614 [Phenylobacterium sp.]|nr:hypothetical protein [Phenylobacterium sp.]